MSGLEDKLKSILNDPEQMGKIAQMAKSLMAEEEGEGTERRAGASPGISSLFSSLGAGSDAETLEKISRIMSELSAKDDDKTALLKAMEPYLSDKRRDKMDKAIKIARFARLAGIAMEEMGDFNV